MTYALSCTLADRIAAFGPLASAVTEQFDWCSSPAPVVAFHGTADPLAPYEGAKVWIAPMAFPSIPEWIAGWARRNRCVPTPLDSAVRADVTRREYTNCADEASVVLYTVKGGGHQWFGGTKDSEWLVAALQGRHDDPRPSLGVVSRHTPATPENPPA